MTCVMCDDDGRSKDGSVYVPSHVRHGLPTTVVVWGHYTTDCLPIGNCPKEGMANGGQESGITRLRCLGGSGRLETSLLSTTMSLEQRLS